jgi:hypothetical protein
MNTKVYIVFGEYVTEDDHDTILKIFSTYEKAHKYFISCVADEQESDWFKELIYKDITEGDDYWEVYQDSINYARYSLEEREVE